MPQFPLKKHRRLIYDIVWTFHNASGIEWDELYSEALVGYVEACLSHDREKAMLSTWATIIIEHRLEDYRRKNWKNIKAKEVVKRRLLEGYDAHRQQVSIPRVAAFRELMISKEELRTIFEIIMKTPQEYAALPGKFAQGKIKRLLRKRGWTRKRARLAMEAMHTAVRQM